MAQILGGFQRFLVAIYEAERTKNVPRDVSPVSCTTSITILLRSRGAVERSRVLHAHALDSRTPARASQYTHGLTPCWKCVEEGRIYLNNIACVHTGPNIRVYGRDIYDLLGAAVASAFHFLIAEEECYSHARESLYLFSTREMLIKYKPRETADKSHKPRVGLIRDGYDKKL